MIKPIRMVIQIQEEGMKLACQDWNMLQNMVVSYFPENKTDDGSIKPHINTSKVSKTRFFLAGMLVIQTFGRFF